MSHDAALVHAKGFIKYLKKQYDVSLCGKMLIKKLQLQIKKKCFSTKKQKCLIDFFVKK